MSKAVALREKSNKMSFWERSEKSKRDLLKNTIMNYAIKICRMILLFGVCFMILQPILDKISISFKAEEDLYNPMVISIPENFTTDNYTIASELMSYSKTLGNTVLISLTIAVLQIAVCTLVGYGFARFQFPLKNLWFACVILMIVVPPQTISPSLVLNYRFFDIFGIFKLLTGAPIGLRGSVLPYYMMSMGCMGLKNGLYIYMIRQFFRNIPKELEEAAYVDGCGTLKTFIKIMLPDARPILTSCFLFAFVWQWTDGFYSRMFLGNVGILSREVSAIGDKIGYYMKTVRHVASASEAYTNCIVATGTLMVVVPLLVLYLFAQKGFVESISSSGIKM